MRFYNRQHPFYCGIDLHTSKCHRRPMRMKVTRGSSKEKPTAALSMRRVARFPQPHLAAPLAGRVRRTWRRGHAGQARRLNRSS